MPTENRSSNTEMVSLPEGFMLVERSIWTEQQVEAATACITRLKGVPGMRDCDLAMAAIDAAQCKAPDIALSDLIPAPQPHPDPIAWMVGTAFWWTKEEAERDAADTGLPIVGLGPMAGVAPADQQQGEPVALPERKEPTQHWVEPGGVHKAEGWNACRDEIAKLGPLYTHSDPSEVERLREDLSKYIARANDFAAKMQGAQSEAGTLRAQLAEAQAHPLRALGQEAYSTLVGMVEHCLNQRVCMGMDEGFKSFDPEEEHDCVKELREFLALSASAEPSALPDPLGCNECTHAECGRFDGPRQVECRAMADNACARPGASS